MSYTFRVFLAGCFLAMIFIVPLSQVGIDVAGGQRPQSVDVLLRPPFEDNLRLYEQELEESSWLAHQLRPRMQFLRFAVLNDLGEKAVVGKEGWLFYKPDVQYLIERSSADASPKTDQDDAVAAIVDFRDQLAERGIQLIVVPIPGKPSIYPDKLTARMSGRWRSCESPTLRMIARIRQFDVEAVNLFEAFRKLREEAPEEAHYLARDTHWSGATARFAAQVVVQRVLDRDWLQRGTMQYNLRPLQVRRESDIVRMTEIPGLRRRLGAEFTRCNQVLKEDTGELYEDDPRSPVLLLGDSFSRIYQSDAPRAAGFIAHVARELGQPVSSLVNDGGASTRVRQMLQERPDLLRGKKLVIWEFVERDIRFGEQGWKLISLSR